MNYNDFKENVKRELRKYKGWENIEIKEEKILKVNVEKDALIICNIEGLGCASEVILNLFLMKR